MRFTGFSLNEHCQERPKNNFAVFLPLTLPSPAMGEGFEGKIVFQSLLTVLVE